MSSDPSHLDKEFSDFERDVEYRSGCWIQEVTFLDMYFRCLFSHHGIASGNSKPESESNCECAYWLEEAEIVTEKSPCQF
jgi:hypothetical protein